MRTNVISIIIPNRNSRATIGKCLEAVFSMKDENVEVIVVDDCSDDGSVGTIKNFPCRLIQLEQHSGASHARNVGAFSSTGDILFFIDADCVLRKGVLSLVRAAASEQDPDVVIGGTYTRKPYDRGFFSTFQSVFVNYSETKKCDSADYIATHALIIDADTFRRTGGFPEHFLPILEDVEFSHRLRRAGYKLIVNPDIQVQHIFNFSFLKSMRNAMRKSLYWTMYSIGNRDLLADSGTASTELKINGTSWLLVLFLTALGFMLKRPVILGAVPLAVLINLSVSRKLVQGWYETGGVFMAFFAVLYYIVLYPSAIWAGVAAGALRYQWSRKTRRDRTL